MASLRQIARALADKLGVEYDEYNLDSNDTRYFIGYWSRVDNRPRPRSDPLRQEGWDTADAELAAEPHPPGRA